MEQTKIKDHPEIVHSCEDCKEPVRHDKAIETTSSTGKLYFHKHCWEGKAIKNAIQVIHNGIKPMALALRMIRKIHGRPV